MKHIYILGNGQLGQMLRQSGEPLGIYVYPIALDTKLESLKLQNSIITNEIEYWPENNLTKTMLIHKGFINRHIFPHIVDRLKQKKLFNKLKLATADWHSLFNEKDIFSILNKFKKNDLVIVKRRLGSYDGHDQRRLYTDEIFNLMSSEWYNNFIVEQSINFIDEISLIGARNNSGKIVFYPITYNLHKNGILRVSITFPKLDMFKQSKIENMLSSIMQELNYVGVMAIECFLTTDNKILVNEIAPRVHNSGHWTQNGASISQFELHLRAISNLPLPNPIVNSTSVMINLIGINLNYSWLKFPILHLHWYYKDIRKGRKVGHININDIDLMRINSTLKELIKLLPLDYYKEITWVQSKIDKYSNLIKIKK